MDSGGDGVVTVGEYLSLDSGFDASTDYHTLTISDDEGGFGGDHTFNEQGDDGNQTATVTNSSGGTVASGRIYLEQSITLSDGDGNTFTVYTVEINGTIVGLLSSPELVPGVEYKVTAIGEADANPSYSSFAWPSYDPDLGQYYEGGAYSDEIIAGAGDDTINAGGGDDWIEGGDGNDSIYYGAGGAVQSNGDTVYGGAGDDIIDDVSGSTYVYDDTLYGEAGNDTIWAGGGDDEVYGGDDNDTIYGEGGDDELYGDAGDDTIYGGDGYDLIWGGTGNDWLYGGTEGDELYGGAGNDVLFGEAGDDLLMGEEGDDQLYGGSGTDTISGGTGNDTFYIVETSEVDYIYGDEDWDTVDFTYASGSTGVTLTFSGDNAFDYTLDGTTASGSGNSMEQFNLTSESDVVDASADATGATYDLGAGDDSFTGGSGNDAVYGGDGADTISTGLGGDYVEGGAGDDTIDGGAGDDWLDGGEGNDTIYGGVGDDTLIGGAGTDVLWGESGQDTFLYYDNWGADTVYGGGLGTDFDTLDFSNVTTDITVTFTGWEDGTVTDGSNTVSFDNIEAITGGSGDDTIDASADGSGLTLDGGAGSDTITGGSGDDVIATGSGTDTIVLLDGFGNDTITDWDFTDTDSDGFYDDQLDVSGLTDALGNPISTWDVSVSDDGSGNAVLSFPNGETLTLLGVAPSQVDSGAERYAMGIPCFCSGTRIMTPSGERRIEELRAGDLVVTLEAGPQPILWHGERHLGHEILKAQPELLPIVIRDGTLGNRGDLWVSPQHGLVVPDPQSGERVFARATHLERFGVGGVRRALGKAKGRAKGKAGVTYHHLLLPRHATLIANNTLSESLYPGRFALSGFDRVAKAELFGLFPALEGILRAPARSDVATGLYGPSARPYLKAREVERSVGLILSQGRIASQHQMVKIESAVPIRTDEAATRLATPYILANR
ncbi:Hint domain-containing protein [Celeribacter sp. SCSIO 80788]|uniref:Hint domain-containing protein n=1 Tax=Celeribacter sp. SCSIO 80788 TaxID=3117013 RepID=UPI003DA46210